MHLRALMAAVPLALLMAFLSFLLPTLPLGAVSGECLVNADFSAGFDPGGVPLGWHPLSSGPAATCRWGPFLLPGRGSGRAFLALSTLGRRPGQGDSHVGLYQTVDVVPGGEYRLGLRGTVRTAGGAQPPQVQWGLLWERKPEAGTRVEWQDVPLGPAVGPAAWPVSQVRTVRALGDRATVVVQLRRGAGPDSWAVLVLESLSLQGPYPAGP